jgi:hypothetical protein
MNYEFNDAPPEELAVPFPCNALMHWPGYDTEVIDLKLDGRDVVIQLWKGYCPKYMPGLPGGIGAEVGLYYRSWQPGMWWPDHEHKKDMSFTLINPVTNEEFFRAGPQNCWWLHKWMAIDSYKEYSKTHQVPDSPTKYVLKYVVSGQEFTW